MICRLNFQILQTSCIVYHNQLAKCHPLNIIRKLLREDLIINLLGFFVGEALNHTAKLYPSRGYMSTILSKVIMRIIKALFRKKREPEQR